MPDTTLATVPETAPAPQTAGGLILKELRERRLVSQSKLAKRAGFDHSFVSRCESGTRTPTRDAVDRFAAALDATPEDRARLMIAYGFLPDDPTAVMDTEPELARLYRALRSTTASDRAKRATRMQIGLIAIQLEQV